ncbi:MAG: hypothetical protein IK033_00735, partial [Verrucomicrobia bacterium]|nr:hypothetical protein [Verrucomicrobiota bacterium]
RNKAPVQADQNAYPDNSHNNPVYQVHFVSCMLFPEAKSIPSFHFDYPAIKLHSGAVDYSFCFVVQLL